MMWIFQGLIPSEFISVRPAEWKQWRIGQPLPPRCNPKLRKPAQVVEIPAQPERKEAA